MQEYRYIFKEIHFLTNIDIFCYEKNGLEPIYTGGSPNPFVVTPGFLEKMLKKADDQTVPAVYQDEFQVLFACIKKGKTYYLLGPMSLGDMNHIQLHRYYARYAGAVDTVQRLPVFAFSRALALVGMLSKIILNEEYSLENLISGNRMAEQLAQNIEQEQILFQMEEDKRDAYHHTYSEECELLACVRDGRVQEALTQTMRIDITTGRMSKTELTHWKNVVVVAIALCVRAAIEGGLPPKEAYQLSDFYLQKSDECKSITELIAFRNRAIQDLTERVHKRNARKKSSNYVERCKDYIDKHYKEKIYLGDLAAALGVSSTYLSRLFSKETGIRLQDYITQYRVEKAANLLVYSNESIANISEYVNFPSQSYFGKVFKQFKQMTPGEYRELYQTIEIK